MKNDLEFSDQILEMNNQGNFYQLTQIREDDQALRSCIEETVKQLLGNKTDFSNPGMLLGKIQSGKTRAFIGVIALAFDNGYDMSIVLTKGTKALAAQTYERLRRNFYTYINNDEVQICDIMHLPSNFTKFELQQKLVIVVKKEVNNLNRIIKALQETYPDLSQKKILIVDDEADYASIGFHLDKEEGIIELKKIARQINDLRSKVASCSFLQVTATPYSLYLQPEDLSIESLDIKFKPIRPAFTVQLPSYEGYIGGDCYFKDNDESDSASSYLYQEVPTEELQALGKEDKRVFKLEEVLQSPKIEILRLAVINFIVGACIRRLQQRKNGQKEKKYSFIIHTERARASHAWQERIVICMKEMLAKECHGNSQLFNRLISDSYDGLLLSIQSFNKNCPTKDEVFQEVKKAIEEDYLMIARVNSENDIKQLLDDTGQLKLRTPLNIFIGGQILDRGLTIDNLIGFYYGRRPNRFQQDTVLQHSRMYGFRPIEDLAVTRFYTAKVIYDAMKRIHELDLGLRDAFTLGAQGAGVVFVHKDSSDKIVPCSPNKILLSTTTTLRPYKRILPVGFQTDYKTKIKRSIEHIDELIATLLKDRDPEKAFLIDVQHAKEIIHQIYAALIFDEEFYNNEDEFKAVMEFLSQTTLNQAEKSKVWCLVRFDRNLSRFQDDKITYSDAPDSKKEREIAKQTAIDIPIIVFLEQNGKEELGWRGASFWWPVLIAPKECPIAIYAKDTVDEKVLQQCLF